MVQLSLALLRKHILARFPVASSTGGGYLLPKQMVIRFQPGGCANRPFYRIIITNKWRRRDVPPFEQLGTYDMVPNDCNERLLSLNLERVRFWIGQGAYFSPPMYELLGLIGFLPIFPRSRQNAWRGRMVAAKEKEEAEKNSESSESAAAV